MRSFSSTLINALATNLTTLGWLMKITRRDGTVIRLNTIGADYVYNSETYNGYPGFNMGDASFNSYGDASTLAQDSVGDSIGPIYFNDVIDRMFDGAEVILTIVDWTSGIGQTIGFEWTIGNIKVTNAGATTFDIWSKLRTNNSLFLKKYGAACTADLGDARCGVDIAGSYQDSVSVSGANIDSFSFVITPAGHTDNYYERGAIKFTSGENNGFSYDVMGYVQSTGVITLRGPLRRALSGGETALIYPGCDWSTGANGCSKFGNNARYQGFKYLPVDPPIYPVGSTTNIYQAPTYNYGSQQTTQENNNYYVVRDPMTWKYTRIYY